MRQYTIQVDVQIGDDPDFNCGAIEDQVLGYIDSCPILRGDILAIRSRLTPIEERESIDLGPSKTSVPNETRVTINDIVRAVRSGAHDSLRYALEAFYHQCKTEPAAPVVVRVENKDPEISVQSSVRTRLYNAVFPLMNKRFKEPHTVPSRFFNTWTSPISVFLDPTADVADSTATCEDVWDFVRSAIAQEFNLTITENHPLYRYTPGWTLATIAKLLTE